ncbi:MAG: FadR/GntR family transcriptional regulator [Gemmataceae bacterium]
MAGVDRVREIVEHFERQILSGEMAPGHQLPAERVIAAEMGVSRSVVREAISRLASLGLVRSVHGSGTRVEAPSGRLITQGFQHLLRHAEIDLRHLAEVRLPLETTIAGLAAKHRTMEHLTRLEQTQRELAAPQARLEEQVRADLEFHAILAEASGNPFFGLVLAPIQELLIESRRRTLGRHGALLALEHHAVILEAVRRHDEPAAMDAMSAHLLTNVRHLAAVTAPINEAPMKETPP